MSEQEIKEQISQDTNKWCRFMLESEEDYDPFSHEQGRIAQDKDRHEQDGGAGYKYHSP